MTKLLIPHRILLSLATTLFLCAIATSPALGQNRATVAVDLGKTLNMLTNTSVGSEASVSSADCFNNSAIPYLRAAGVTSVRFPGSRNVADLYHWSAGSATDWKGGDAGYINPQCNFPRFALFAEQLGQGIITVNYGSNLRGSGGGDPQEAAAWVAYANGNPSDTRSLGVNWHTVGYWAALRSQAPLATDDGLNFLRINHPRPFAFHLWQIGDEVYNNGYYGDNHTGDPDLHAPAPASAKEVANLKGNAALSPAAYAANLQRFAKAMKTVDPSIEIGAAFTVPPNPDPNSHDWAPNWDSEILKQACADIDFVTFDWTFSPLLPPDWKTLDEASLLRNENSAIDLLIEPMLQDYKRSCPSGHLPRLAFAPADIPSWVQVHNPVVKALWVADFYTLLIESGSANINWGEIDSDSMLSSSGGKPGPAFYGLQMLHIVAYRPGDLLVDARSSSPLLAAHATRRRDGVLGLMLINKDPQSPAEVKVKFHNGSPGKSGRRIDYGSAQFNAGRGPSMTPLSVSGDELTVTVPPYTITDILLPESK